MVPTSSLYINHLHTYWGHLRDYVKMLSPTTQLLIPYLITSGTLILEEGCYYKYKTKVLWFVKNFFTPKKWSVFEDVRTCILNDPQPLTDLGLPPGSAGRLVCTVSKKSFFYTGKDKLPSCLSCKSSYLRLDNSSRTPLVSC
jgi:hypothetical protein